MFSVEGEYFFQMFWNVFWLLVLVVAAVWVTWRKVKEKRRQNDLAMLAVVEARKLKMKNEQGAKQDGSVKGEPPTHE